MGFTLVIAETSQSRIAPYETGGERFGSSRPTEWLCGLKYSISTSKRKRLRHRRLSAVSEVSCEHRKGRALEHRVIYINRLTPQPKEKMNPSQTKEHLCQRVITESHFRRPSHQRPNLLSSLATEDLYPKNTVKVPSTTILADTSYIGRVGVHPRYHFKLRLV